MKITHVASSISRKGAGVSKVVRDLSEVQASNGDNIEIVTLQDQYTCTDQPNHKRISVVACQRRFLQRSGYAPLLKKKLSNRAASIDVIHIHGLWMYPNWGAGDVAKKHAIPYIISPHGMLEPWGLERSRWKKKLARLLFENRNLRNARCLHACSEQEAHNFRRFGYSGPIAIVPIGLTTAEFNMADFKATEQSVANHESNKFANRKVLLFLSRLHVKKGLENLLTAWKACESNFSDWHLVIAGAGDTKYVAKLHRKVMEMGLAKSVTFIGPVFGEEKWKILKQAEIFVLPTYSENFGLVVVEALACGVPVITTKGAPWSLLELTNCGWWLDIGIKPLEYCMTKAMTLSYNNISVMGQNGRALVKSKFLIDVMSQKMHDVYKWMQNESAPPECVIID